LNVRIPDRAWLRREGLPLALITAFAVFIRSIPAWVYSTWGPDYGVYYAITMAFVSTRDFLSTFPSTWGSSGYGSFPMLYWIVLAIHYLTGIPVGELLVVVPPIIGGLCVVPFYFLTKTTTRNRWVAVVAAALLAVNPIHVYQTSTTALLVVGHFFGLLTLYLFVAAHRRQRYFVPLLLSTIALILSHHLSTYIYFLSMVGMTAFKHLRFRGLPSLRLDFIYLSFTLTAIVVYWSTRAPEMWTFMSGAFFFAVPAWAVIIAGYAVLACVYMLCKRGVNLPESTGWTRAMDKIRDWKFFVVIVLALLVLMSALAAAGAFDGRITFLSIAYSTPFLLTLGFIGVGFKHLFRYRYISTVLSGWMLPIALSGIYGLFTWNHILLPDRHLEYLVEPLSAVGGLGFYILYRKYLKDKRIRIVRGRHGMAETHGGMVFIRVVQDGSISTIHIPVATAPRDPIEVEKREIRWSPRLVIEAVFMSILLLTAAMAYPMVVEIHKNEPYMSEATLMAVEWLVGHGDRNYTVATDHRVGLMLKAYGFNSSFEYVYFLWNSTRWTDAAYELLGMSETYPYPPVKYVLIDDKMYRYGVGGYRGLSDPYVAPIPISEESYEKFSFEPFHLVERFEVEAYWAEIYEVNWSDALRYISSPPMDEGMQKLSAFLNSTGGPVYGPPHIARAVANVSTLPPEGWGNLSALGNGSYVVVDSLTAVYGVYYLPDRVVRVDVERVANGAVEVFYYQSGDYWVAMYKMR